MLPRKYPSLLPAATPRHEGPLPSAEALQEETNKRKRIGTQVACNLCRVKKTRVRIPAPPVSAANLVPSPAAV